MRLSMWKGRKRWTFEFVNIQKIGGKNGFWIVVQQGTLLTKRNGSGTNTVPVSQRHQLEKEANRTMDKRTVMSSLRRKNWEIVV
jgi:hypothetical protein